MFHMNPLLKAFLKTEGIYLTFILNALFSSFTLKQKIKMFRALKDPDKFILAVLFDWRSTAEGSEFWEDKSRRWIEFYFVMRTNGYMKAHNTDLD